MRLKDLGGALAARGTTTVVLDGVDRVVGRVAEAVASWTEAAPDLKVIVTSQLCPSDGAWCEVRLSPLEVADAVELLKERAALVAPAALASAAADKLVRLVEAFDRLPIAIGLAASQLRYWSVDALLARLTERAHAPGDVHKISDGERRLFATLEDSWARLDRWSQMLLCACALFPRDFRLEELEGLKVLFEPEAPWTLDVLEELCGASLVETEPTTPRSFYLLNTTRSFVRRTLRSTPRYNRVLSRFYGQLSSEAKRWTAALYTDDAARAARELERLVPALETMRTDTEGVEPEERALAALMLGEFLWRRGLLVGHAERLLNEDHDLSDSTKVALYQQQACFYRALGQVEDAQASVDAAFKIAPEDTYTLYYEQAFIELVRGQHDDCLRTCAQGYALADAAGDLRYMGLFLDRQAAVTRRQARYDDAEGLHLKAIDHLSASGSVWDEASARGNYALVHFRRGHLEAAVAAYERALEEARAVMNAGAEATTQANLGSILTVMGRHDEAARYLSEALRLHQISGQSVEAATVAFYMGRLEADREHRAAAEGALDQAIGAARGGQVARLECVAHIWRGLVAHGCKQDGVTQHHYEHARTLLERYHLADLEILLIAGEAVRAYQNGEEPQSNWPAEETPTAATTAIKDVVEMARLKSVGQMEQARGLLTEIKARPIHARSVDLRQLLRIVEPDLT